MAFQRYQARAPLVPDDRVTIGSTKVGKVYRIVLNVGKDLVEKLGLEAGDRVDIFRGTHSDRELLKLTRDGSDADFRENKRAEGALVLTFVARQWSVSGSYRAKVCKHRQAEDGTLFVVVPGWMRGESPEDGRQ